MKKNDNYRLSLDEQFVILLHKKIMNKTGSTKRRAKKYYKDQYRKTGIIPKPLVLAEKGIMEGRKCSGRPQTLTAQIKKRFVEMIKASCDLSDNRFIFISRKGRTIKNYHIWLEEEFNQKISLTALRRYVKKNGLKLYLDKPDFDEENYLSCCFKEEDVFDLVQVDGCQFRYFKIRNENNAWQKPQVIEFFDTGSRLMFVLDSYFSESNQNSVDIFSQFLLSTSFPEKKIRIRPDNAKGFLNLKRPINELNIKHSLPNGFFMEPDFSRINAPKDKVHLESSHRSLHNFEMRIIKFFEDRISKTEHDYSYRNGKKIKITVTYLDINLEQLRKSGLIETYRLEQNNQKHYFSVNGTISSWVPTEKFNSSLSKTKIRTFVPDDVRHFMKYGFKKIKATVSTKSIITFKNQTYYVAVGAENFSRNKSTKVYISSFSDKLFIFENRKDGILLGEALRRKPFVKQTRQHSAVEPNDVELITAYLEEQKMVVDRIQLIEIHNQGLTPDIAKTIYANNKERYLAYSTKLRQPEKITGKTVFNAFILDCERFILKNDIVHYAACEDI